MYYVDIEFPQKTTSNGTKLVLHELLFDIGHISATHDEQIALTSAHGTQQAIMYSNFITNHHVLTILLVPWLDQLHCYAHNADDSYYKM